MYSMLLIKRDLVPPQKFCDHKIFSEDIDEMIEKLEKILVR